MTARQRRLKAHDRQLLRDQPMAEEQLTDYPVGWYFARFSEDLAPGQVVPVEFMSHQFALFRGQNGTVGMVDSQCCHMGADLGRCGTVAGDRLVCGYHAWEFNAAGRCTAIPKVQPARIPPRARQRAVPVLERAGNIWFWYGPEPTRELLDISCFDSPRYTNIKGQIHIGRSNPLPMFEHVADSYHFPHNHRAAGSLEYLVTANDGHRFEFQLQPTPGSKGVNVQRFFKPHAFIEMAGPCIAVYRAQKDGTINRTSPLLTVLIGATPVRENVTVLAWRIAVRRIGPNIPFGPLNWLLARALWFVIAWNVHVDLEVLKWMRPPAKTLWVKPDGSSVREYRNFYHRNIVAGWRPGVQPVVDESEPQLEPQSGGSRD